MGFVAVLMVYPPACFIWIVFLLIECVLIMKLGGRILNLSEVGVMDAKSTFTNFTMKVWGIDILAMLVSSILMLIITSAMPFFADVYSEWGIAAENAYFQAVIYVLIWVVLYSGLLSPSYVIFKRKIKDSSKRKKLFVSFIAISALVWAVIFILLIIFFF